MISMHLTRLLSLAAIAVASSTAIGEIAWRDDLQKAHAEATSSGKPLLLHFYGDNCPWCEKLEAGAFATAEVGNAIKENFIPVKIHTGKNPNLVQMFKVKQIPTDVVVTTNGQVLSHGTSKQQPADFVAVLAQSIQGLPASAPANTIAANAESAPAPAPAVTTPANPAQVQPAVGTTTTNNVTIPVGFTGGATGQLAGVRTEGMTLGTPEQVATTAPQSALSAPSVANEKTTAHAPHHPSSNRPELALEGYCPVTLVDEVRWEEGNSNHGVIHLGKLYLFASDTAMQTFLANPEPYTPVLNEIDVVRFFEERVIVPGKRTHGTRIKNRMFFFADEDALEHFQMEWERYYDASIQVMENAIKDANPGT
jgi:thioredoxin-related protein/YHS domain-containing protein